MKSIKKLIRWCPNAKVTETGPWIYSTSFESYNQPGGEKSRNPKILSQFSKLYSRLDVRILLPAIFLSPFYINILIQRGVNTKAFFLGLSLSLIIYCLYSNKQMQRYNAVAKKPVIHFFSKKKAFEIFLAIILFGILFILLLPYTLKLLDSRSIFSFLASVWLFLWGNYFQLIYWEKKNHMRIYIKNENGFQKIYAVSIEGKNYGS
ncbi:MAG: DUF1673 family protein [Methanosarcina sp.]